MRVQAVAPGATATDFRPPVEHLPQGDAGRGYADAMLADVGQGEAVTIPALSDAADWHAFETARQKLAQHLSHADAVDRYLKTQAQSPGVRALHIHIT